MFLIKLKARTYLILNFLILMLCWLSEITWIKNCNWHTEWIKKYQLRQALRPGALGKPRGSRWRGRWEGGSGWGTHVNPWLFYFNVWQNPPQIKKKKVSAVPFSPNGSQAIVRFSSLHRYNDCGSVSGILMVGKENYRELMILLIF